MATKRKADCKLLIEFAKNGDRLDIIGMYPIATNEVEGLLEMTAKVYDIVTEHNDMVQSPDM